MRETARKLRTDFKVNVCFKVVLSSHHEKRCSPTLPWCRGNKSEEEQAKLAEKLEHVKKLEHAMGTYKLFPKQERGSFYYTKEPSDGGTQTFTLFREEEGGRWTVKNYIGIVVLRCKTSNSLPLSNARLKWEYRPNSEEEWTVDDDKAIADAKKAVDTQQVFATNLADPEGKDYKPDDSRVVVALETLAGLKKKLETLEGLKKKLPEAPAAWTNDDDNDISCDGVKSVSKGPLRACGQMFYYILPTVSTVIFQCIPCRYFGDETGLSDDDYTDKYLAIDYRVACDSDKYNMMKLYAYIMILVYPVGVPLSIAILLGLKRHLINPIGAIERKKVRI